VEVLIVGPEVAASARLDDSVTRTRDENAARNRLASHAFDCLVVGELDIGQLSAEGLRLPPVVQLLDPLTPDRVAAAISLGADDVLPADCTGGELHRALVNAVARRRRDSGLFRTFEELERLATVDPLTGLLNRRGVEAAMAKVQAATSRGGVECHFLLIDLDDFKRVNDRYGWEWGDRLLEGVGRALADTFRSSDHVARVGGDEFLVLLPTTRLAAALELARRIRAALGAVVVHVDGAELRCRASLGVARASASRGCPSRRAPSATRSRSSAARSGAASSAARTRLRSTRTRASTSRRCP